MKKLLIPALLILFACSDNKPDSDQKNDSPEEQQATPIKDNQINDLWVLDKIDEEDFVMEEQNGLKKTPQIEIIVNDGVIEGNDGCNTLKGKVSIPEKGKIQLSQMSQTKMACMNTTIPQKFMDALNNTKKYNVSTNYLLFYNAENKELLRLKRNP